MIRWGEQYYRIVTNNVYLNWKAFPPSNWKRGTLKSLSPTSIFDLFNTCTFEERIRSFGKGICWNTDFSKMGRKTNISTGILTKRKHCF